MLLGLAQNGDLGGEDGCGGCRRAVRGGRSAPCRRPGAGMDGHSLGTALPHPPVAGSSSGFYMKERMGTWSCKRPHDNHLKNQIKNHCSNFDNETDSVEELRVFRVFSRATERPECQSAGSLKAT